LTPKDVTLFANRPRDCASEAGEEEPTWAFLDRVDDPVFDRVRRLMNAWFAHYPSAERTELRARLSSGDDIEFHSAWFELYLHELHRRLAFDIAAHPVLDDVTTRPDFRLTCGASAFLLEATIIGNRDEAGRAGRRARIVAALNRTRSDDFTLLFDIETEGESSPAMRDVRRRLDRWLAELDWASVRAEQERVSDLESLPTRTERVGAWTFSFQAWPRQPKDRGRPQPAISAGPSDGAVWDHGGSLLDRLESKAGKYGKPSDPVLIAVRMDRLGARADDVLVALLGPTVGRLSPADPPNVVSTGRRGAGLFRDSSGRWRNRHVAGVLFWDLELRPWSVARRAPTLWLHPQPAHPLPRDLPWRRVDLRPHEPQVVEGDFDPTRAFDLPGAECFDSPSEWPGVPFERRD